MLLTNSQKKNVEGNQLARDGQGNEFEQGSATAQLATDQLLVLIVTTESFVRNSFISATTKATINNSGGRISENASLFQVVPLHVENPSLLFFKMQRATLPSDKSHVRLWFSFKQSINAHGRVCTRCSQALNTAVYKQLDSIWLFEPLEVQHRRKCALQCCHHRAESKFSLLPC